MKAPFEYHLYHVYYSCRRKNWRNMVTSVSERLTALSPAHIRRLVRSNLKESGWILAPVDGYGKRTIIVNRVYTPPVKPIHPPERPKRSCECDEPPRDFWKEYWKQKGHKRHKRSDDSAVDMFASDESIRREQPGYWNAGDSC